MHCSFVISLLMLSFSDGRGLARVPPPSCGPPPFSPGCLYLLHHILFQESYLYSIPIHASNSTTATFMREQKWREKQSEYAWVDATVLSLDARRHSTRTSSRLAPASLQTPTTNTRYLTGSSLAPAFTQPDLGLSCRMAYHDTPTRCVLPVAYQPPLLSQQLLGLTRCLDHSLSALEMISRWSYLLCLRCTLTTARGTQCCPSCRAR